MSKTNHGRGFKEPKPRRYGIMGRTKKLSDRAVGVTAGGDAVNGHRGEAKAKRGAKKRLRVLERLDGKKLAREGQGMNAEEAESVFRDVNFDIAFTRKFDGEKFFMRFSSPALGVCGGVQTNERRALDGAVRLLNRRLIDMLVATRKGR